MAVTQEMVERFKAAYPAARSPRAAALAAGWPGCYAAMAAVAVAVSLGLPPKARQKFGGRAQTPRLSEFEAWARQFEADDEKLQRLCEALRYKCRVARKKAAGQ